MPWAPARIMTRILPLFALTTLMLVGCGSNPSSVTPLKLYVFDCGRLNFDSLEPYGIADDETDVRDLIVPCYVIDHQKGRLLWEGGLPSRLAEADGWQEMDGGWRMRLDRTFEEQLIELGLSMNDFDYMSFSHFHFDHVGVANEVEGAKLIIQRREYDNAFADPVTTPGFSPELYSDIEESEIIIIDGEHDVFGDGRVRLISAPGHTAGHQVLYLDLPKTGPVVLSGDLYVFHISRETRKTPTFHSDATQTLESRRRIEAYLEETGAELWIGHELDRFHRLKKPPEYHD